MTALLYLSLGGAALVFAAATVARAARYARTPVHLRWELYPLPEGFAGQSRAMAAEIFLLLTLWRSNRALWYRSFPFHAGLYLVFAGLSLLAVVALATVFGVAGHGPTEVGTTVGGWRGTCLTLAAVSGGAGVILATLGAAALLHRRITDTAMRGYTTPGDLFNLAFFVVALGLTGVGYLARPTGSPGALAIALGLFSWDTSLHVPGLLAASLWLDAALVAYIPLTHMAHFVAKYFTYHAVRWDERPLAGDRGMAARLAGQLASEPTWSAQHVRAGGAGTWTEVAASNPTEGKR